MKDLDVHKKVAVLIDADNAQLSKLSSILDEISAHGHVLIKRAYRRFLDDGKIVLKAKTQNQAKETLKAEYG